MLYWIGCHIWGPMMCSDFLIIVLFPCRTTVARAKVINEWSTDGGMLLMGYEMYRLLSLKKSFVSGRRKKSKKSTGPVIIDLDEEDRQQELLKGTDANAFYALIQNLKALVSELVTV